MALQIETLEKDVETGLYPDPEGEYIDQISLIRGTLTLLTRVDQTEEGAAAECGEETENGTCGRTVDSPEDKCWQHE